MATAVGRGAPSLQPPEDQFTKLTSALLAVTLEGQIQWTSVEQRPHRFLTRLATGNLEIASIDDDGDSPYELLIYSQPDLELLEAVNGRREQWRNAELGALYAAARRNARGVTQAVDKLLSELANKHVTP